MAGLALLHKARTSTGPRLLAKQKLQAWQAELVPGPAPRRKIPSLAHVLLSKRRAVMANAGETLAASASCSARPRRARQPGKHRRREAQRPSATAAHPLGDAPEPGWALKHQDSFPGGGWPGNQPTSEMFRRGEQKHLRAKGFSCRIPLHHQHPFPPGGMLRCRSQFLGAGRRAPPGSGAMLHTPLHPGSLQNRPAVPRHNRTASRSAARRDPSARCAEGPAPPACS